MKPTGPPAHTDATEVPLWEPSPQQREDATLTAYLAWVTERHQLTLAGYEDLWRWSVTHVEDFWASVWDYFGVASPTPYERVLSSHEMPGARWFEGAQINYAQHMFRDRRADEVAILHASELRDLQSLTWGQLAEQVAEVAAGLGELGVGQGDRVVAYLPNVCEAVVAFLACASLGAVWSSCSPDFGARSVVDRFAQIEPRVLFAVDGYRYGGRDFDRLDVVATLQREIPTLEHTILLAYLHPDPDRSRLSNVRSWDELRHAGVGAELEFTLVPFQHPLWVLYSSGTTGLPKAIVQSQGGILLEQLKKGHLHLDLHAGDRMFWFTTTGWMMWNFLVGCLLTDAAIVLFDGNPAHPDLEVLWQLAQRSQMTCLGTSAGFLTGAMNAGLEPRRDHDLSRLRAVGSTGSPLAPEAYDWVYSHVKEDVWLFSTSGGTDVCTAFVGGCPLLPVYAGEIQCRALGAAVAAWNEQGEPVVDEVGELVITEPLPSMPLYFWGDADGERYHDSYFAMWPGVWRHGDWIRITPRGGAVISGRSDSTINRQGVRMGTAEIYRAVTGVGEVSDALVVDVPTADGELVMHLFVVLEEGAALDEDLVARVKRAVREDCSPRHVPNLVHQVEEVPRTLSGKVLEVPVKRILMGTAPERAASVDSLANPGALDYFVELAGRL